MLIDTHTGERLDNTEIPRGVGSTPEREELLLPETALQVTETTTPSASRSQKKPLPHNNKLN